VLHLVRLRPYPKILDLAVKACQRQRLKAYFVSLSMTKKNCFITMTTRVNVIKLFFFITDRESSVFVQCKSFSLVKYLRVKLRVIFQPY
jgi:hypothetical protein